MIDVLTNSFLLNPVPLQLTLNYCSHGCAYCFANLNNPKRKADLPGILSQLKNYKNRSDIVSFYLKEKYPLLISNNIDPFSKNNYKLTEQILDVLLDLEIPIQLNTRGGYGWENVISKIKKSVFYISVPFSDDKERQRLEPNAPDLKHRFDMAKELLKIGHKVIVGINPFDLSFSKNHSDIIDQYSEIGVKYFWINKLHITYPQRSNLTELERIAIGEDVLTIAAAKGFNNEWLAAFDKIYKYTESKDCKIIGAPSGHYEAWFGEIYSVYNRLLPTQNDFFKYCEENLIDGDLVTFGDFYSVFIEKIPEIECDVSKYIFNKAILDDKSFYKKTWLSNLLHVLWDSKAGLKLPEYYPVFSWAKRQTNKLDWIRDENGDRIMVYHPVNYNHRDYLVL